MRARTALTFGTLAAAAVSFSQVACESEAPAGPTCETEPISRFQELLIVDEAVIADARTLNSTGGPWSYRHAIEEMTPPGMTSSMFVREWVKEWSYAGRLNTSTLQPRPLVTSKLLCPWLRQTESNACNPDCSVCAAEELDLTKAPFRTIAISNRMDQRPPATPSNSGEGRIMFALTQGPADDPASLPLGMTLIFEYQLIGDRQEWARRWHDLGKHQGFDEEYKTALVNVTEAYIRRGSNPGGPAGGNGLAQVRSNEREFDWQWEMREFELTDKGMQQRPLANTPDSALNGTPALIDWVRANQESVLREKHSLPTSLRGAVAQQGYSWTLPNTDEPVRKAFARQTCNGCHQSETDEVDSNFHISPFRKGIEKISPFLSNPADPAHDDLATREQVMHEALCGRN
jgi:hypothetical protein